MLTSSASSMPTVQPLRRTGADDRRSGRVVGDWVIASRRLPASFTTQPPPRGPLADLGRLLPGVCAGCSGCRTPTRSAVQRCWHRRVTERVVPLMSSRDFLFDVDLLVIARRLGFDGGGGPDGVDRPGRLDSCAPGATPARMLTSALRLWIHHRTMPIAAEVRTAR